MQVHGKSGRKVTARRTVKSCAERHGVWGALMEGTQAPQSRKRGKKLILCDTNIVLNFYFKSEQMVKELDALGFERLAVSSITVGEMYFNMKVKERRKTRETINKFQIQSLTAEISDLFEQSLRSDHVQIS